MVSDEAASVFSDARPPKYEQLKLMLLREIREGRLAPGATLPPEVELAQSMGLARNTVRRALAELESQGLVRRTRGRGTVVCGAVAERPAESTNLMALVLPELASGLYATLQSGFGASVTERSGEMVVCNTEQDPIRQMDTVLRLVDQRVAGIAVVPISAAEVPAYHFRFLRRLAMPVVFCHRRIEGVHGPLVRFSGLEVGRRAGRELAQAGHRSAAFFATHAYDMPRQYEQGLREAMRDAGGMLRPEHVHYGQWAHGLEASPAHINRVRDALQRMLSGPDRPTAIMTSLDTQALLIHFLLGQLGYVVPRDVSLISFGPRSGSTGPAAATGLKMVMVDEERLGKVAGAVLAEMVARDRGLDDDSELIIPVSLGEGGSVAPPPG